MRKTLPALSLVLCLSLLPVTVSSALADTLIGSTTYTERNACTGPGFCYGYGLNPSNGQYEYFYGNHNACSGSQERTVIQNTYQRSDGSTYITRDAGGWSVCHIQ